MLGAGGIGADQQFLIELLARAQPGVDDGDLAIGMSVVAHLEPAQADHQARKVVDLDRLAHVEHEHVAAACHGAGLQHQFGGLRDRHEVAHDFRMRDGDRTACLDLLAEAANDGPRAVQHIAEADHRENGCRLRRGAGLQHELSQPLACAHDVGRPHGLVGRDQHHALDAGGLGGTGDDLGAEHVVHEPDRRIVSTRCLRSVAATSGASSTEPSTATISGRGPSALPVSMRSRTSISIS